MNHPTSHLGTIAIIACDVLRDEVVALVKGTSRVATTLFLRQGLHNDPPLLRTELQQAVNQIEEQYPQVQQVALVYGLCSRGIEGVSTARCSLIIPRAHDCITLLLGDRKAYDEQIRTHPGTYWYSPGWNRCHIPPGPERYNHAAEEYRKRFSEDDVQYLLETEQAWMQQYTRAAYVELPVAPSEDEAKKTRDCADWLKWEYTRFSGDVSLLRDLITGHWDDERYLVLGPGQSAVLSADDRIIKPEEIRIIRKQETA